MKSKLLGQVLMAAVLVAGAAGAATHDSAAGPRGDADVAKSVRHEILMYPSYSIWDDISFRVENGSVELMGAVNQPYKKQDIARLVQRAPGVASVTNEIRVLPLSPMDDRLRLQVARAIYSHPALSRYGLQAVAPIHIIVENGHVTLDGVVNSQLEKQVAGMRASAAGLSFGPVVNNLQVENSSSKKS
jgi:hyperosmotically inducible protein